MRRRDALRSIRKLTGLKVADISVTPEAIVLKLDDGGSVGLAAHWFDGSRGSLAAVNDALRDASTETIAPYLNAAALGRLRRSIADFSAARAAEEPRARRQVDPLLREAVRVAALVREPERWAGWSYRPEPVGACPACGEPTRITDPSGVPTHPTCVTETEEVFDERGGPIITDAAGDGDETGA